MLIITRRRNESFLITVGGHRIVVACLGADRGRAKLGIDAPKEAYIVRTELLERNRDDEGDDDESN